MTLETSSAPGESKFPIGVSEAREDLPKSVPCRRDPTMRNNARHDSGTNGHESATGLKCCAGTAVPVGDQNQLGVLPGTEGGRGTIVTWHQRRNNTTEGNCTREYYRRRISLISWIRRGTTSSGGDLSTTIVFRRIDGLTRVPTIQSNAPPRESSRTGTRIFRGTLFSPSCRSGCPTLFWKP